MVFNQKKDGDTKNNHQAIDSADRIILGGETAHKSIFDLGAVMARNNIYEGFLHQFHLYPYGNKKGNELTSTELMNVESVTFYTDYPFNDEYKINVPVDKEIGTAAQAVSLDGKRILPSAHKYVTVKYTAEADATITLSFPNLYDLSAKTMGKTFTVTINLALYGSR